jgi:hypothetical protein
VKNGCPNCDDVIGLRGNNEKVDDCTSPVFEGIITLHEPSESWVAKWQRLDGYVPGIYAVKVTGNVGSTGVVRRSRVLTGFVASSGGHHAVGGRQHHVSSTRRQRRAETRCLSSRSKASYGIVWSLGVWVISAVGHYR